MSATHHGCGCLVNRDAEDLLVTVSPCERHRSLVQIELQALYQRVLDIRDRERLVRKAAQFDGPDIEVVYVDEDPLPLTRRKP